MFITATINTQETTAEPSAIRIGAHHYNDDPQMHGLNIALYLTPADAIKLATQLLELAAKSEQDHAQRTQYITPEQTA